MFWMVVLLRGFRSYWVLSNFISCFSLEGVVKVVAGEHFRVPEQVQCVSFVDCALRPSDGRTR